MPNRKKTIGNKILDVYVTVMVESIYFIVKIYRKIVKKVKK